MALALATGCGAPTAPHRAPPPEQPIAKARAAAIVKAGLLRASDLPGWRATRPEPDSPGSAAAERALASCMGRPALPADAGSAEAAFVKGTQELGAAVSVAPTLARADEDLADLRNAAFLDCFLKVLPKAPPGVDVRTRHIPATVRGADGAVGMAVTLSAKGPRGSASAEWVVIEAHAGHAELSVWTARDVGERTMPSPATLAALLARLVARVRKV